VPRAHAMQAPEDTARTELGRLAAELDVGAPGEAPVQLLVDGVEALAARLQLVRRAERTLDLQYYLVRDDVAGRLIARELLAAADRGVRVRLCLDDILTAGLDPGLRALDAHPGVEVRLFNPFPSRTLRLVRGALDFRRLNRRMHNKSFTADGRVTLVGGRNLAAEYFAARADVNFGDLDVLAYGRIAGEVAAVFEAYWSDRMSVPLAAVLGRPQQPGAELAATRARLEARLAADAGTPFRAALDEALRTSGLEAAGTARSVPCRLVHDPPGKARGEARPEVGGMAGALRSVVLGAREELLLVSPYFVPRRRGTALLRELRGRGVAVRVVTNSLAANNHAVVHSGYMAGRPALLRDGVELYEVRGDASVVGADRAGLGDSRSTLHTKAFVSDRRTLFVGSFNFDPRSAHLNTEMGILLESPELARDVLGRVAAALPARAYRVELAPPRGTALRGVELAPPRGTALRGVELARPRGAALRWVSEQDGEPVVLAREPAGFWRLAGVRLLSLLPIRGQL